MPRSTDITIFDISRPISSKEPIYPGNAPVKLQWLKTFSRDGSYLSAISFGMHTASHVDAPLHYAKAGRSVDRLDLRQCIGWARVVDVGKSTGLDERAIKKVKPQAGEILLLKTKNSGPAFAKKFRGDFTHIDEAAARLLVKANVKAVGTDGPSIRKFHLRPDTVHPLFAKAGILLYEGLNFSTVKPGRYFFIGLPLRVVGAEASPVRAVLMKS